MFEIVGLLLDDGESILDGSALILLLDNEAFHVVVILEKFCVTFCSQYFDLVVQLN